MPKGVKSPRPGLGRSKYGQKVRDAQSERLSGLRGKEKGSAARSESSFDAAVAVAKRFKEKKGK